MQNPDKVRMARRIGHRIAEHRAMRGWSQRELGRRADLTIKSLSSYENGHSEPALSTLEKIADALDVNITVFFDGIGWFRHYLRDQHFPFADGPEMGILWHRMNRGNVSIEHARVAKAAQDRADQRLRVATKSGESLQRIKSA